MIRRYEPRIWTGVSLLFLAVAVYVAVFTDNSFTVYAVGTVTFAAMARIAALQRQLDALAGVQPRPLNLQAPVSQEALAEFAAKLESSKFNR